MDYAELVNRLRDCRVAYTAYDEAADAIVALQADLAAARALLTEARATLPDMRHTERLCARIDAAIAGERREGEG